MEIELCGYKVLIDDEDYEKIKSVTWVDQKAIYKNCGKLYFVTGKREKAPSRKTNIILLHRYITKCPKGKCVDHINGNTLDNRKSNLRICTIAENCRNQKRGKANTSGYKGVTWSIQRGLWIAQIKLNKKNFNLGGYKTKEEAFKAYCDASEKLHGEFGRTE